MLAGFTAIFINYIIGKPGSQFSPYEIFSGYTVWLSKQRLKRLGLWVHYKNQYTKGSIQNRNDFRKIIYEAAEQNFTWERAVGMCVVCTGFWIALIWGICTAGLSYFTLIKIIVVSHVTIRLLQKIYD